ncbi:spirocyclase AveC family protein [Nocardia brasiliensis]|uniref:spirocyclase AveC family protein n=1 Tax=Nocardia brasiliensis TaxID=37326 RepID=UPI003794C037
MSQGSGTAPTSVSSPTRSPWRCPSVYWACLGVAAVLVQGWVLIRWAFDGNLHAYPATGYTIPGHMRILTHVIQAVTVLLIAGLTIWCRRESRRRHEISLTTALFIGCCLAWWTNPYASTFHYAAAPNRYDFNVPSWGPYLPGWRGETPVLESFVLTAAYMPLVVWVITGLFCARLLRRYRPRWSVTRIVAASTIPLIVFDVIVVQTYVLFGGFGYPRAVPGLTLFEGQWYQQTLTNIFSICVICATPMVAMAFSAEVRGRTVHIFRGSENLPRRVQPWIRILAGIGLVNLCILGFQAGELIASLFGYPNPATPSWYQRPL